MSDTAMDGHVFANYKVITEFQCADYCLRHVQCVAFNYQSDGMSGEKSCELLSSYGGLVSREGFIFEIYHRKTQTEVSILKQQLYLH